jgi:hypothetical protein
MASCSQAYHFAALSGGIGGAGGEAAALPGREAAAAGRTARAGVRRRSGAIRPLAGSLQEGRNDTLAMANESLVRDVLVLAYQAFGGAMRGKTLLQKRLYFVSVSLGVDLGYEPHYYGPYSEEVAAANAELKSLGYLSESVSAWGVDQRGFERARHDYALTDAGVRLAARKSRANPELAQRIEAAARIVSEAGNLDYMELSAAAKAYYILTRLGRKATIEEISAMLPRFGWALKQEELEKAAAFLQKMGLAGQKGESGR